MVTPQRAKEVVEWLRQRSRPYLFSNSLAPAIVAASIKVLEMVEAGSDLRDRLWANARQFREQMSAAGFTLAGADHAIIPVMLGDAVVAQAFARELQKRGDLRYRILLSGGSEPGAYPYPDVCGTLKNV